MAYFSDIIKKKKEKLNKVLKKNYGFGNMSIMSMYAHLGLNKNFNNKQSRMLTNKWFKRFDEKHEYLINKLDKVINKKLITHELLSIKAYLYEESYKGFRHLNNLPLRGQRTHTNRKTQRQLSLQRHLKLNKLLATKEKK